MEPDEHFELCVIGAGTAGFAAAQSARRAGRTVAIVTGAEALGGTCIRRGCMPAKTLLRTSEVEGIVAHADRLGIEVPRIEIDVEKAVARERALVDEFAHDRIAELERFPLRRGAARFVAPDAIDVGGRRIGADRFLIATGSRVAPPAGADFGNVAYLVADDVLVTTEIPRRLVVFGGGPVGCEFAQYFRRMGSHVTIVEPGARPLRAEDDDVAAAVIAALRSEGIELVVDARRVSASRNGQGVRFTIGAGANAARTLEADALFLAGGRRPWTNELALDAAGVATDSNGAIVVDAGLRTANPRIYAAGDVLGWRCMVHSAAAQGAHAARNAFAAEPIAFDRDRWDHHAIATQPQISVAGLTERSARQRGIAVRVARLGFDDVGKALVADEADGFVKIVATPDGRIVGCAVVGEVAIDLGAFGGLLVEQGIRVDELAEMPYLHPTMSEAFQRVAERWLDEVHAARP